MSDSRVNVQKLESSFKK